MILRFQAVKLLLTFLLRLCGNTAFDGFSFLIPTYGYLTNMKIDNMRVEHRERVIRNSAQMAAREKAEALAAKGITAEALDSPEPQAAGEKKEAETREPYALIAVAAGEGMAEIFEGIGASKVIVGGQTMNPSVEDFLNAAEAANADVVYIFPNNGNVILTAMQASEIEENCRIIVIPSKTIPQGITAMINFSPELSEEEKNRISHLGKALRSMRALLEKRLEEFR